MATPSNALTKGTLVRMLPVQPWKASKIAEHGEYWVVTDRSGYPDNVWVTSLLTGFNVGCYADGLVVPDPEELNHG